MMKVVLMQKINKLGDLGDVVQVKPGYARNYLVPYAKACYATPENVKRFEEQREKLLQAERQQEEQARQRQEKLHGASITIAARVSGNNKLFGSVTQAEIVKAIKTAHDVAVEKKEISRLPRGSIRELGEYKITIQLHSDVEAQLTVNVVAEAA